MGMDYSILRPVMSIILTAFPIFPELHNIHNIFQVTAKENPNVVVTDDFQIHFLRIAEFRKRHPEQFSGMNRDLRDWLNFFAYGAELTEAQMSQLTDHNPLIREAYEEMQRFFANPETRELARERRQFIFDFNLGMDASKAEGKAVGKAEGKAEGKADSIAFILQERFQTLPSDVQTKLFALHDIGQLDHLRTLAFHCQSLEEFTSQLR
jgi:predicted transposase/invertase (TIGR01784 family)